MKKGPRPKLWQHPIVSPTQHNKDRRRAVKALGRPLARRHPVHHHSHTQLVICESMAYHRLLEHRTRAFYFGCNPTTERVCFCCRAIYSAQYNPTLCPDCVYFSPIWGPNGSAWKEQSNDKT